MPARLTDGPRDGCLLGRGSPVRYYLPAAPLTVGATVATVLEGWRRHEDRPALAPAGVLTVVGARLVAAAGAAVALQRADRRNARG